MTGVGSSVIAFNDMFFNCEHMMMFEKNGALHYTLSKALGVTRHPQLFCGYPQGDVLKTEIGKLPTPRMLVCGPPCPPWSTKGLKEATSDPRSSVFDWVLQCVEAFWKKPEFLAFALENVGGILTRFKDQPSYVEYLKGRLQLTCPGIRIYIRDINIFPILPQNRRRVWILGLREEVVQRSPLAYPADPLQVLRDHQKWPTLYESLGRFPALPAENITGTKAREYLAEYKEKLKDFLNNPVNEGSVACMDLSRGPNKVFGATLFINKVPTIDTSNVMLFLIEGGKGSSPPLHRFLHVGERFAMQGLMPTLAVGLSRTEASMGAGNAFPPVRVGAIVNPLLMMIYASRILETGLDKTPVVDCLRKRRRWRSLQVAAFSGDGTFVGVGIDGEDILTPSVADDGLDCSSQPALEAGLAGLAKPRPSKVAKKAASSSSASIDIRVYFKQS